MMKAKLLWKKYFKLLGRSQNGFSLMEVVVTVGLVGLLGYGIMKFKGLFTKEIKRVEEKAETLVGVNLANKIMVDDFILADPSFSFIDRVAKKIPCVNDEQAFGENETVQFWSKNNSTDCYGAEIVLKKNGDTFSYVISDHINPDIVFFLPEKAYNYQSQLGANINFDEKKFIDFLKGPDANIWKKNSFYKLEANSHIKDPNYSDDPIKYALLFTAYEKHIVDYFDDNIIQVLYENCQGKSNYDGLDLYFRCMPLDGSDFRIKAQAVRYISYRLERKEDRKKYKGFTLYKDTRRIVKGKIKVISTNLVSNIKKVSIKRKDASSNIISFDIEFYPRKQKEVKK